MLRGIAAATLCVCLIAPFAALLAYSDPESRLPACCRRDGKHHCAMMMQFLAREADRQGEISLRAIPARCPYRSGLPARTSQQLLGPPHATAFCATFTHHSAVHSNVEVKPCLGRARSHLKRGPPYLRA